MNKYLAEFIGTGILAYVYLAYMNPLAIGLTLALVYILTSNISGGHVNPAISIVMASIGKLETNEIIPYILSQMAGGLVGLEIFKRFPITP